MLCLLKSMEYTMNKNLIFNMSDYEYVKIRNLNSKKTELLLSQKAYWALRNMNHAAELNHCIDVANQVEKDHRHHIKVPEDMISVMRHTINDILKKIKIASKIGRCKYGEITRKNLLQCLNQLHG